MTIAIIYNEYSNQLLEMIFSNVTKIDIRMIHPNGLPQQNFQYVIVKEPNTKLLSYLNTFVDKKHIIIVSNTLQLNTYNVYPDDQFKAFISLLSDARGLICRYQQKGIEISFKHIIYISKSLNKCEVYVKNRMNPLSYNDSLANLNKQLPNFFISINRSEIVNFFYIKAINKDQITLLNHHKLYISRRNLKKVHETYIHLQLHSPL